MRGGWLNAFHLILFTGRVDVEGVVVVRRGTPSVRFLGGSFPRL